MPERKFSWKRIIIIVLVALAVLFIYSRKNKAETEENPNEHVYDWVFETPDPYGDIYDVIESENPEPFEPELTFSPIQWGDPDDPLFLPYNNTQLKYDPFLVYSNNGALVWKRLNGTVTNITPPVSSSQMHSMAPTNYFESSSRDDYALTLKYFPSISGISQSTTEHYYNEASLVWVLNQTISTQNDSHRMTKGDRINITLFPKMKLLCTQPDFAYMPSAVAYVYVEYASLSNASDTFYVSMPPVELDMRNDGADSFNVRIEHDQSKLYYVTSWTVRFVVNPIANRFYDNVRSPTDPMYYYSLVADPSVIINYYNERSIGDIIGTVVNQLFTNISGLFVPDSAQIGAWIASHTSDELDSDNPLNLVKDLFVSLMETFSGYSGATSQIPVIQVPPLEFTVAGQTVQPFNGYRYIMTDNDPGIWTYVKLCITIIIVEGLVELMLKWFYKWYDAHYAR